MSILLKALVGICLFAALLALPTALKVDRSLPCTGVVTSVEESQHEERYQDGQSSVVFESFHHIDFKNPVTFALDSSGLKDISQGKGESVELLYDPRDKAIEAVGTYRLYKEPIIFLCVALVIWLMALIAVRS